MAGHDRAAASSSTSPRASTTGCRAPPSRSPRRSRELYEETCRANAQALSRRYDFVVIHDPQPLAMRRFAASDSSRLTGSGAATSTPRRPTRSSTTTFCRSSATTTRAIYTMLDYVPDDIGIPVVQIAPGDRPLAPKNMALSAEDAALHHASVRHRRGAAAAAAGLALRPLEGPAGGHRRLPRRQARATRGAARARGLHGERRPRGLGVPREGASSTPAATPTSSSSPTSTTWVASRSTPSSATPTSIVQKSHARGLRAHREPRRCGRRGRRSAATVGGIPLQIEDGVTGYLVSSRAECAQRCLEILADPRGTRRMALARQGARAPRVPHAAAAARRPAPLHRALQARRG